MTEVIFSEVAYQLTMIEKCVESFRAPPGIGRGLSIISLVTTDRQNGIRGRRICGLSCTN